jgi:hypothetical protein
VPAPATASGLTFAALVAAGVGFRALVPALGDAMAHQLLGVAASIRRAEAPDTEEVDTAPVPVPEPVAAHAVASSGDKSAGQSPSRARVEAIDIPADRLARLTAKQLRGVHATDAVDPAGRPMGARLHGVGSLGVGLGDGDVVASIDGHTTPTADDATGAALGAYASGETTVHGTLLRSERTVQVTVHVPSRAP